jgi:hypothetical protein
MSANSVNVTGTPIANSTLHRKDANSGEPSRAVALPCF